MMSRKQKKSYEMSERETRMPGYNFVGERLSELEPFTHVKRKYTVEMLRKAGKTTRSMTKRDRPF